MFYMLLPQLVHMSTLHVTILCDRLVMDWTNPHLNYLQQTQINRLRNTTDNYTLPCVHLYTVTMTDNGK